MEGWLSGGGCCGEEYEQNWATVACYQLHGVHAGKPEPFARDQRALAGRCPADRKSARNQALN